MKSGATDALEKFKALEDHISQVLDLLRKTRGERESAESALREARSRIKLLEKEISGLQKERTQVRGRVESLIESISDLNEKQIV